MPPGDAPIMDEINPSDLDRWEAHYLKTARHETEIVTPKDSPVADRMIQRGLIEPLGFVIGRYACWKLRSEGIRLHRMLTGNVASTEGE